MNCAEAREMFTFKLDNLLSGHENENLREHLEGCPECNCEWKEWEKIFAALHSLGTQSVTAPSGFASTVMAQIKNEASPSTRVGGKRWKQAAIGTAAALLLVSGSLLLKPTPTINIADVPPVEQTSNIQPDANQNIAMKDSGPTAQNQPAEPSVNSSPSTQEENPLPKNIHEANSAGAAQFTSKEELIVLSTFLKIKVDDARAIEQSAISRAQNQGASVQSLGQQSEGGKVYLVDKIIISSPQAPGLINILSGLGTTISCQEQKEDFTSRYNDLVDLLISLEGQRSTEQDGARIATLDQQIEQIQNQLKSWDKRVGEQTIVLWIEQ